MADWVRTSGDQVHSLYAQLTDSTGALDIPPNTQAFFVGRLLGATEQSIGGTAQVVRSGAQPDDPNRGFVRYDLSTSDVATSGIYYCKFKLIPPGSTQTQSFPEDSSMILLLLPSLG